MTATLDEARKNNFCL